MKEGVYPPPRRGHEAEACPGLEVAEVWELDILRDMAMRLTEFTLQRHKHADELGPCRREWKVEEVSDLLARHLGFRTYLKERGFLG